jgi:TIR domain
MAHVFISHASADGRTAEQVRRWLATDGHDVFLAQARGDGVTLGDEWQPRPYERLRWADAVVCLVSQAYRNSTWCTAELAIAHERGRRILPILVELAPRRFSTAAPPLPRSRRNCQDLSSPTFLSESSLMLLGPVQADGIGST